MRYTKEIATAGLALLLSQSPLETQTNKPQQTTRQTTQTQKAYRRDEEFLKLYEDLRRYEDYYDRTIPEDNRHRNVAAEAGDFFQERARQLAKRYGLELDTTDMSTCGNYISLTDFGFGKYLLGEFNVASSSFGNNEVEKIFVQPAKDGYKIVKWESGGSDLFNMQRISDTDFWSLRDAILLYRSQIDEKSHIIARNICAEDQLSRIERELLEVFGIFGIISNGDLSVPFIRAPKGSNRIILTDLAVYNGIPGIYSMSIAPDGKNNIWFKDVEGKETFNIEATIKFGEPKK